MSQRGFAEMIGMDCGQYNRYETGELLFGDDFLEKFKDACSLTEAETELLIALRSCDRLLRLAIKEDESE